MKSTVTFKEYFKLFVEMDTAGVVGGSGGGFSPNNPNSSDFYAPGKNYIPTGPSVIQRRKPINTLIKVGKKRKPIKRKYKK